jgi:hypothetical protein
MHIWAISLQDDKLFYGWSWGDSPYTSQRLFQYDFQTKESHLIVSFYIDGDTLIFRTDGERKTFTLPAGLDINWIEPSIDGHFIALGGKASYIFPIIVIDTHTGNSHKVEKYRNFEWNPEFGILFYFDDDYLSIYNAIIDGTQILVKFQEQSYISFARMSPDSRYMAYRSNDSLHILDSDTGATSIFRGDLSIFSGEMKWVDETRLVYSYPSVNQTTQTDDNEQRENMDLWLYDAITDKSTQLTHTPNINENIYCRGG